MHYSSTIELKLKNGKSDVVMSINGRAFQLESKGEEACCLKKAFEFQLMDNAIYMDYTCTLRHLYI